MKSVKVKKDELLEVVSHNREGHRETFQQALEGYKAKVRAELEDYLRKIEDGMILAVRIALPKPEEHLDDYDRALTMIRMSVDDVIELNESDFASLVMDDWGWKGQFEATSVYYTQTV